MINTAGRWNPNEENVYFIASVPSHIATTYEVHPYVLCAINEFEKGAELTAIERIMDSSHLLIDSGVFSLANSHAVDHCITMDEALSLAPDQVDGFDKLYKAYCDIIGKLGAKSWGYIEIDQGGRENKIKTRAKLEKQGFRPIPVYHPFNDGWDYFDYLAQNYDRICFGNVVQADSETRKRLLATAYERQRKYPHLWIHLLGMTPNEWLNAYPINSCDSSTWLHHIRWNDRIRARVCCKGFSDCDDRTTYDIGSDKEATNGYYRALKLAGYDAHFIQCSWRGLVADYHRLRDDRGAVPSGGMAPLSGPADDSAVPEEPAPPHVPRRGRNGGRARGTRDRVPHADA